VDIQVEDAEASINGTERHCRKLKERAGSSRHRRHDACVFKMITFQIAGYLTEFTDGNAEIRIDTTPKTVRDALNELWNRHVGLRDRVLTEQGDVRQHVNIFVNNSVLRRDEVMQAALGGNTEICIMPAVSGGDSLN
jgi:molybdopterin synthase sulfur carrier subunit